MVSDNLASVPAFTILAHMCDEGGCWSRDHWNARLYLAGRDTC